MKKIQYDTDQNDPQVRAYKEAVKKGALNQHIILRGDKWIVKRAISEETGQIFNTQKEATEYANSVATAGTAVFIHNPDGRIEARRDF